MLSQAVPGTKRATLIEQRLALIASGAEEIPPMPTDIVEDEGVGRSYDEVIGTTALGKTGGRRVRWKQYHGKAHFCSQTRGPIVIG